MSFKIKITMVWIAGEGKEPLFKKLFNKTFSTNYKSTVGVDLLTKHVEFAQGEIANLAVWHITQKKRFELIRSTFYKGAAGAILFFDPSRAQTYEEIKRWLAEIQEFAGEVIPFLLIGWNQDLLESVGDVIDRAEARQLVKSECGIYIESSSQAWANVEDAIVELTKRIINMGTNFIMVQGEAITIGDKIDLSKRALFSLSKIGGFSNMQYLFELDLSCNRISEIKELKKLTGLKILNLRSNQIKKLKGVYNLTELTSLDISDNYISTIHGFRNLINLKSLRLKGNNIPDELIEQLGGLNEDGYANEPQKFVEYCCVQVEDMLKTAKRHSEQGKHKEAIKYYKKVLQYDETDEESRINLGSIYFTINELDFAERCFRKVARLEPSSHLTWYYLGLIEYAYKNYDSAIENYKKATKLKPDHFESWINLGLAYREKKDYGKALEIYEKIALKNETVNQQLIEINEIISIEKKLVVVDQTAQERKDNKDLFEKSLSALTPDGFNVFLCHSLKDSELFQISKISEKLKSLSKIDEVSYWMVDRGTAGIGDKLKNINAFIFFCTQHSMDSSSIDKEWKAAFQLHQEKGLTIIVVYFDRSIVPILLKRFSSVKYDDQTFEAFIEKLYNELRK